MRGLHAVRRPVENTYLVRERDRRITRELMAVLAAVLVLGGGLLGYTWVHIEIMRSGYRTDKLDRELYGLLEEERRWRLEAAHRAHPERIEKRASEELGMRAPSMEQTLFFEELTGELR